MASVKLADIYKQVTLVEASLKMCMTVLVGMHSSHVDVLPALTILLRHYAYVQGTQANPKKVWLTKSYRYIYTEHVYTRTHAHTHI